MKVAKRKNNKPSKNKSKMSLADVGTFTNVPAKFGSGSNSVTIRHRELIGPVDIDSVYSNQLSLAINPGLLGTFPWLARVASNFETYKFQMLQFEYEPSCAATSTGNVYMAVDFDVSDPDPITEREISSFAGSVCTQSYGRARMDCPTSRMGGLGIERYIRSTLTLPANQDNKTYDVGKLIVGTVGSLALGRAGLVWVSYVVQLITPGIPTDLAYEESARIVSGGTITRANPFGDAPVVSQALSPPINSVETKTAFFNDPGQYIIDYRLSGTGLTGNAPDLSASHDIVSNRLGGIVNAAATEQWERVLITTLAPLAEFIIDCTAIATTVTGGVYRISPYKYSLS